MVEHATEKAADQLGKLVRRGQVAQLVERFSEKELHRALI